jgi:hypothetical protein
MKIMVEVEEGGGVVRVVECEVSPEESVHAAARRLAELIGVETDELVEDLGAGGVTFEREAPVRDCLIHGERWRHRRVCIELHFETEHVVRTFPPRATWVRVHRWGCHRFHVPQDACANLELREGEPTGPALNEKVEIGVFAGCKVVWLVKPGPEPNG